MTFLLKAKRVIFPTKNLKTRTPLIKSDGLRTSLCIYSKDLKISASLFLNKVLIFIKVQFYLSRFSLILKC